MKQILVIVILIITASSPALGQTENGQKTDGRQQADTADPRKKRQAANATVTNAPTASRALAIAAVTPAKFSVLQLNLCNGGYADCYKEGNAIGEGIGVIKQIKPDVVTVNEICRNDASRMAKETGYRFVFTAARNLKTGGLFKCTRGNKGQDYGVGILTKPDYGNPVENPRHKAFASQSKPEQNRLGEGRVYGCARYAAFAVCTTHLTKKEDDLPNGGSAPMAQCKELMAYAKGLGNRQPTVVGGDLNMEFTNNPNPDNPNVQICVPNGWFRKGDGKVQHILAPNSHFGFVRTKSGGMIYTDHPWFLVELNRK